MAAESSRVESTGEGDMGGQDQAPRQAGPRGQMVILSSTDGQVPDVKRMSSSFPPSVLQVLTWGRVTWGHGLGQTWSACTSSGVLYNTRVQKDTSRWSTASNHVDVSAR